MASTILACATSTSPSVAAFGRAISIGLPLRGRHSRSAIMRHAVMSPVAAALMRALMSGSEYAATFLSASTAKRGRLPVGQPFGLPLWPGFHDVARRPPPPLPRPGPVLAFASHLSDT